MTTLRYRASARYAYASALLKLVELARAAAPAGPHFEFGPLVLDTVMRDGLVVSVDDDELQARISDAMAEVPGLVLSPD